MREKILAAILTLLLSATTVFSQEIAIVLPERDATYLVTVKDGVPSVVPTRVFRPTIGGTPTTPTTPSDFKTQVAAMTKQAIDGDATPTTAVALASIYGLVGDKVAAGEVSLANWPAMVRDTSNTILDVQKEREAWAPFRDTMSELVSELDRKGALKTKEQVAALLADISAAMRDGAGVRTWKMEQLKTLVKDPRGKESWDLADKKGDGILDGINLDQIIRLIELIMKLIEAFGGGDDARDARVRPAFYTPTFAAFVRTAEDIERSRR